MKDFRKALTIGALLGFILAIFFTVILITQAKAQTAPTACATRAPLVERLAERYSESRVGVGLQNASQMLEVYASPETGTWTILITWADGLSCIVATGTNWFNMTMDEAASTIPGEDG